MWVAWISYPGNRQAKHERQKFSRPATRRRVSSDAGRVFATNGHHDHGRRPAPDPRRSGNSRQPATRARPDPATAGALAAPARPRASDAWAIALAAAAGPESAADLVADAFDAVTAELDPPLFAVTCRAADGRPAGCLVGFASQCSIAPPRFLACISRANHTYAAAADAGVLAVHLVPREAAALARLLGGETDDEVDKFGRCAWHSGPFGAPILDDCPNWFVGRVRDRLAFGDHVGFLLDPVAAGHRPGHVALGQRRAAAEIAPGHPA